MSDHKERKQSSSTDRCVDNDDNEELHRRKRALTRKIDRRILPLLW